MAADDLEYVEKMVDKLNHTQFRLDYEDKSISYHENGGTVRVSLLTDYGEDGPEDKAMFFKTDGGDQLSVDLFYLGPKDAAVESQKEGIIHDGADTGEPYFPSEGRMQETADVLYADPHLVYNTVIEESYFTKTEEMEEASGSREDMAEFLTDAAGYLSKERIRTADGFDNTNLGGAGEELRSNIRLNPDIIDQATETVREFSQDIEQGLAQKGSSVDEDTQRYLETL